MKNTRNSKPLLSTISPLNAELQRLLKLINMNRTWVRGKGVWLYDHNGREFLDCYAQYGAVALGHNAESVVAAMYAALAEEIPAMVQPYLAPHAIALAEELIRLAPPGLTRCVFTTSGAETVEAAIKLVRMRTGRPLILSCEGAYHGKTMGALAVSGRELYAHLCGPKPPSFAQVPFGNVEALAEFLERHSGEVAALFLEPIQGERGVFLPPPGYLAAVRELCHHHEVALVLDEIQTGLGRTGRLFYCEYEKVTPDLLLLSKAIGGGLFPLGVCLVSSHFWDPRFALVHSSTFANNNVACRVGLAVLTTLIREDLCVQVTRNGTQLLQGLHRLAARYPKTIAEVRGCGLLCAIQLHPAVAEEGLFRSYLHYQGLYAYAIAAMLAEQESVLVLPALNDAHVLRLTPPLIINEAQIDKLLAGLETVFALLEEGATDAIVRVLGGFQASQQKTPLTLQHGSEENLPIVLPPLKPRPRDKSSYAFLIHYTCLEDVVTTDPALARLSTEELHRYCEFIADIPPGVVFSAPPLRSATGATAHGYLIALGMLPEEMFRRGRAWVLTEILRAVDLAANLGVQVVGLGAFTTVFSRRGLDVLGRVPVVTTGNALTAGMAFAAIQYVLQCRQQSWSDVTVGIVGAQGSVGSLCAKLLARTQPRNLILVGNPASGTHHLQQVYTALTKLTDCPLKMTRDFAQLRHCQVILSATSSSQAVLDDAPLQAGTLVCDVARPPDASERLRRRHDITVIDGGLVRLPDSTLRFGVGNIQGFPDGVQLACLAETILLTLAQETRNRGIGDDVALTEVDEVMRLAAVHGFTLAVPDVVDSC